MFDIGWSELMLIGAIALIVVGPKDLPGMLRTLGKYAAQARGMAREFQRSMEDAAREADISEAAGLKDTARELRDLGRKPFQSVSKTLNAPATPAAPKKAGQGDPMKSAVEPAASTTDASASAPDSASSPSATATAQPTSSQSPSPAGAEAPSPDVRESASTDPARNG